MSNSHDDGLGVKAAGYYGGYKLAQERQEHSDMHALDGGTGSLAMVVVVIGWLCVLVAKYPRTALVLVLCWCGFWQVDHWLYDYSPARFARYISFVNAVPGQELNRETIIASIRSTDPTYSVYDMDAVCHIQTFYDHHTQSVDGWETFVADRDHTNVRVAPNSISAVTLVPLGVVPQGFPFAPGVHYSKDYSKVDWGGAENTRILACALTPPSDDAHLAWQAVGLTPDPAGCDIDPYSSGPNPPCHNLHFSNPTWGATF